ncbi:putative nudC protein [Basidiobolus meristosporus CBS 931.73]|uniref:Nuclear movement protein nudC n=1 Tax=Basidiobolus meristosporus CBS 931.73 TaxID=1314790 RepID=A0A1Y1YIK1_9FUNG|nr:putative nudC protein [Basidiobolus meristosporus CBS 931.73]|eukprot:ORX97877.1 putative nudC protein [Basidiobolus meristosporus CBS 931.73]
MSTSEKKYADMTEEEAAKYDEEIRQKEREEQAKLPYQWRQTLQEVDIVVPVPQGVRAKDLNVVIKKNHLTVGLKNQPPIVEGELCKAVKLDDSTWTLEDRKEVQIHLEKVNGMEWWENVVTHHPKIDTTKIQPENSKLEDLDGETRTMVEKMMFDQRQKAMGLPSSEELKKMEMFEKFKQQHPEMDFSQVKLP